MLGAAKPLGVAADLGLSGAGDELASELERQKKMQRQRMQGGGDVQTQPFGPFSAAAMDLGLTNGGR